MTSKLAGPSSAAAATTTPTTSSRNTQPQMNPPHPSSPPHHPHTQSAIDFVAGIEAEFQAAQKSQQHPWEHAHLFDSLANSMYHDSYEWKLLLQITPILLGDADAKSNTATSGSDSTTLLQPTTTSPTTSKKQRKLLNVPSSSSISNDEGVESEEEEDEGVNDATSDISVSLARSVSDDSSNNSKNTHTINSNELGAHQTKAFRYLQVAIIRHLSTHSASHPTPAASQSAVIAPPTTTDDFLSSSTFTPSPAASPIIVPKSGDVLGVWIVSMLCASKNRSVALSFLKSLELLGRVSKLRVTIQKCFQLLQRERLEEEGSEYPQPPVTEAPPPPTTTSDQFISPHLASNYLTPSSLLPLHALSSHAIMRFSLHAALLRTLQAMIGDGVMLPSVASVAVNDLEITPTRKPTPNVWYEFVDTPIFPRISGGAAPSAQGYCWSCWINVAALAAASNNHSSSSLALGSIPSPSTSSSSHSSNIFRFFNSDGHGVQVYLKANTLCVRVLPNMTEVYQLKNFLLHEQRWYFITIVHRPKPQKAPIPAIPVTSNMANVTSFIGKPPVIAPSATFRPQATLSPAQAAGGGSSSSPSSPTATPPRPAQLFLYIDGLLASTNDVPYPPLEHSESMQVSLGGYNGQMGPMHFFHDILPPSAIYSLYTLGGGMYAAPAHHIVNTGLVTVFPPSPSATSISGTDSSSSSSSSSSSASLSASAPSAPFKDEHGYVYHGTPPIVNHRIVSRVLLSHSPGQTTHEYCLPYAWADDWHIDQWNSRSVSIDPQVGTECAMRLPGVNVVHRRNNSQWFVDIGGLKLFLQSLAPVYAGITNTSSLSDEVYAEMLTLLALVTQSNPQNANQLLEIGAASLKQLLFEPLKKKHRTALLINGLKHLLLVISSIDHTPDQVHFASFVSYLLLDFTYWRVCSLHIQQLVVHLYRLLVIHNPIPFRNNPSIGVQRIVDSIRVVTHRFFVGQESQQAQPGQSSSQQGLPPALNTQIASQVPSPSVLSPSASGLGVESPSGSTFTGFPGSSLQINVDPTAPPLHMNPYSPAASSHASSPMPPLTLEPTESEIHLVRALLAISVELAQQSVSSPFFESHILYPFLYLLQLPSVSASNFPSSLLIEFLTSFLQILPLSSHRTLSYLHLQHSFHIFLRFLFDDDVRVRVLALKCIQFVNTHLVHLGKIERSKHGSHHSSGQTQQQQQQATTIANESMYLQADLATAIGSCLSLHLPIGIQEHDALFELLMGQPPASTGVASSADGGDTSASHSASADNLTAVSTSSSDSSHFKAHRGLSLETNLAFCHSSYLSNILKLATFSSLPIQSKILLDLLTLLRSNPHNILVMASLFWQRLLLPFIKKMNLNNLSEIGGGVAGGGLRKKSSDPSADLPSSEDTPRSVSARDTIDVLVYQVLHLLFLHCMTNEPKGWQTLDQFLWCLEEKERVRMAHTTSTATATSTDDSSDAISTTVSDLWIIQINIFNRLFQVLQKSILYLSLPQTRLNPTDAVTTGNESMNSSSSLHTPVQIQNLRRNIPAVFELTEWLLFHCKDSFLAPSSSVPTFIQRRTSSTADLQDDNIPSGGVSRTASTSSMAGSGFETLSFEENSVDVGSEINTATAASRASRSSSGAGSGTSRASLRSQDEPLSESEIELLTSLLVGVVKSYPLPERRQDILRIMFRYLMTVLPHPLCAGLCPIICDSLMHLFTERIVDVKDNEKNARLVALSLYLLKQNMEIFMRREDMKAVEQIKTVMSTIYAKYGACVFQSAAVTAPESTGTRASLASTLARNKSLASLASGELDLLTGPTSNIAAAAPSSSSSHDETPLEQLLFHIYNNTGRSLSDATQLVFEQHEQRFAYLCDTRSRQVNDAIVSYLKKQQIVEHRRERNFALQAMEVQKRVEKEKPFLLKFYQMKVSKAQQNTVASIAPPPTTKLIFRKLSKDVKHCTKIDKLLRHYHYQHANSRPRGNTYLAALLPEEIMKSLHLIQEKDNGSGKMIPSAYVNVNDISPSKLNYSSQIEFWKLDTTESPTRMRRLIKKNFQGSSHAHASQNAATGKTASYAPQVLDLANSLKAEGGVVKGGTRNSGVDVDAVLSSDVTSPNTANMTTSGQTTPVVQPSVTSNLEQNDDEDGNDELDEDDEGSDAESDAEASKKRASKYLLTRDCVMITPERKYLGSIKIAQQHFVFAGTEMVKAESSHTSNNDPSSNTTPSSTSTRPAPKQAKPKEKFLRWPLKQIRMVLPRLYLLRESALEIFFNNFKNYFFNFTPVDEEALNASWNSDAATPSKKVDTTPKKATLTQPLDKKRRSGREQRNEVYKLLCSLCPEMQYELIAGQRLLKSGIMKKWQRGEISNFDYLQHLNTVAGRTYNDINQYPVFPWILNDYKSPTLDLNDENIYRDLSKPIGALNEDRYEIYEERFQTFDDPEIPGFMYGSHYCLSLAHEILTRDGWLDMDAMLKRVSDSSKEALHVTCYDPQSDSFEQYAITPDRVPVNRDQQVRIVDIHTKDEQLAIECTDNHTLWIRQKGEEKYQAMKASELLELIARSDQAMMEFEMKSVASEGLKLTSCGTPPFIQELNLKSEEQVNAFLRAYGSWIISGTITEAVQLSSDVLAYLTQLPRDTLASWMLLSPSLGRDQLRCVLEGMSASESKANQITTCSEKLRDEISEVTLYAGYSTTIMSRIDEIGTEWSIYFFIDDQSFSSTTFTSLDVTSRWSRETTWCVDVPHAAHLIVTRKKLDSSSSYSRPLIIGNSSAGIALYYLIRMEPFTNLAISLQGNHFDLADRLFDSISGAWDLSLNNVGDVKELIPEFFYFPDFLRNSNGLDLGTKQDKQKLGDVILPQWAKGSPEEFVRINRAALESDYVSAHLHEWIDLIFGWKQTGKAAVDAKNVFFYLTYAGAVDIDAIENPTLRRSTLDQIAFFGQTPTQLLTSPHPARFSPAERAKLAQGTISLPSKVPKTFSSQLVYYYQPMRGEKKSRRQSVKSKIQGSKTMTAASSVAATVSAVATVSANDPLSLFQDHVAPPSTAPLHGQTFDADRTSIISQVPTAVCFATRDIVITLTNDLSLQTHSLTAFLAQPPTIIQTLSGTAGVDTTAASDFASGEATPLRSLDLEATEAASVTDDGDSKTDDESTSRDVSMSTSFNPQSDPDAFALQPQAAPSATSALFGAGSLIVNTLTSTPGLLRSRLVNMLPAQRVPQTVVSSHVVNPMSKHWFLEPTSRPDQKEKVTLDSSGVSNSNEQQHLKPPVSPSTTSTSLPSSPSLSSSSSSSSSSSINPPNSTTNAAVTAIAQNGQFLFSGGYFDGSLKCHSILHFKPEPIHDPSAAPTSHLDIVSPKQHTRTSTSPPVLTAASAATLNASGANRPAIQTRRIADAKPLSTVLVHHAPVSALCLAHNQAILFSGDRHGIVCIWRVFTERHERNRPPIASAPLATFSVHEGRVISIASNTYVGVAVSLARDLQDQRGCELCIYSIRGGGARFIRSQLAVDPNTDWQQVVLTANANIVVYGTQNGVPTLFSFSINGQLLKTVKTEEVINVLYATPATARTNTYEGFVVTGGRKSVVVFRSPHTLEPVQSFFCDDLYPQSIAHEPVVSAVSAIEKEISLWDGTSTSSSSAPTTTADATNDSSAPGFDIASLIPPPVALAMALSTHTDPTIAGVVQDASLPLRMGVASFDISVSQQHFVVAMYPQLLPTLPKNVNSEGESVNVEPTHAEGRLLLFPLPHSSSDITLSSFYLDAGLAALDTVRDALNSRFYEGRDAARDKIFEAAGRAGEKLQAAKNKVFSAFSGLFGGGGGSSSSSAAATTNANATSTQASKR